MTDLSMGFVAPSENLDILDGFENEIEEGGGIPWAQIVNPDNLDESKLRKLGGAVYGIFLSADNADAVGFKPGKHWEEATVTLGGNDTEGYLTHLFDGYILSRSQLEVQSRASKDDQWRFHGVAFEGKGQPTQAYSDYESDTGNPRNHRLVTRNLMMFVDEDGSFLHDEPLQLTTRGKFGVTFGKSLMAFQNEATQAYFAAVRDAAKAKNQRAPRSGRLNALAKAGLRFRAGITYHPQEDGNSPYTYINSRLGVSKNGGESKEADLSGLKITVTSVTIHQIKLNPQSEKGKIIAGFFYQHESFGEPNRGLADDTTGTNGNGGGQKTIDAHGFFNWGSINYNGPKPTVQFNDDNGNQYLAALSEDVLDYVDTPGTCRVTGVDDGSMLHVEMLQPLDTADESEPMPAFS